MLSENEKLLVKCFPQVSLITIKVRAQGIHVFCQYSQFYKRSMLQHGRRRGTKHSKVKMGSDSDECVLLLADTLLLKMLQDQSKQGSFGTACNISNLVDQIKMNAMCSVNDAIKPS